MSASLDQMFDPLAHGWERLESTGFIELVGPFFQRRDEEGVALAFQAADRHHNRRGVVQGGMLATLLDRAIGMNVMEVNGGRPPATIQLDIHYLDAVEIGTFVVARCRIERKARSLTFASATAFAGVRPVASAKGVWKILSN